MADNIHMLVMELMAGVVMAEVIVEETIPAIIVKVAQEEAILDGIVNIAMTVQVEAIEVIQEVQAHHAVDLPLWTLKKEEK